MELGLVEQRYAAVLEVINDGATVTDVARRHGVACQTMLHLPRPGRPSGWAVPPLTSDNLTKSGHDVLVGIPAHQLHFRSRRSGSLRPHSSSTNCLRFVSSVPLACAPWLMRWSTRSERCDAECARAGRPGCV